MTVRVTIELSVHVPLREILEHGRDGASVAARDFATNHVNEVLNAIIGNPGEDNITSFSIIEASLEK